MPYLGPFQTSTIKFLEIAPSHNVFQVPINVPVITEVLYYIILYYIILYYIMLYYFPKL